MSIIDTQRMRVACHALSGAVVGAAVAEEWC